MSKNPNERELVVVTPPEPSPKPPVKEHFK